MPSNPKTGQPNFRLTRSELDEVFEKPHPLVEVRVHDLCYLGDVFIGLADSAHYDTDRIGEHVATQPLNLLPERGTIQHGCRGEGGGGEERGERKVYNLCANARKVDNNNIDKYNRKIPS